MNIDTKLRGQATRIGSETAVVAPDGTEWTYATVDEYAGRIATWLAERGVGAGDTIAILLPNTPAFVPALFACWRRGAIAAPYNARFGAAEFEHVTSELEPRGVLTAEAFEDENTTILDEASLSETERLLLVQDIADDALPDGDPKTVPRMDGEEALVMYTMGKQDTPTGVIQTHRNVGAQMEASARHFGFSGEDTSVCAMPLFHGGGLFGCALPVLFADGTLVVQPSWDAEQWASLVEREGGTYTLLVPTMMVDAVETEAAHEYDTSSLRYCAYGGAAAEESTLAAFESTFAVTRLYNLFGQTETTGLAITFDEDFEREPGLLGRASQAVETRVVDVGSSEQVSTREAGELLFRGDIITPGFWRHPALNDEYFTDDWLHTGDIVRQNEDGYFYYVGRADDMIISGGENVAPGIVEAALSEMPGVEAVGVFGVNHEKWGEQVTAAIVADEDIDAADVERFWDGEVDLADYQRPRGVHLIEELPCTETGTVDRDALASRFYA